jgi:hypothetical protein
VQRFRDVEFTAAVDIQVDADTYPLADPHVFERPPVRRRLLNERI